jgi:hypothetical protein
MLETAVKKNESLRELAKTDEDLAALSVLIVPPSGHSAISPLQHGERHRFDRAGPCPHRGTLLLCSSALTNLPQSFDRAPIGALCYSLSAINEPFCRNMF